MRRRLLLITFMLLAFSAPRFLGSAQNPSSEKLEYLPALPGYVFEFPRDHGSHDEYSTEWWYYTGHLRTGEGKRIGFELTFFRVGVDRGKKSDSAWTLNNVALAHFAITDIEQKEFRYYEKLNRASPFTAAAAAGRLDVFNESWSARVTADGSMHLRASGGGDAIDLVLTSRKPPAVHGENGISVKAIGTGYASHYYSMTRLDVRGSVTVAGTRSRCTGTAWMDHEFGSSALREHQVGWDWFSVQFDNDSELMLYVIRTKEGKPDVTSSGSLILADGRVLHLRREQFTITPQRRWKSKKTAATYPLGWRITVPGYGIDVRVRETMEAQELVTHGSTRVTYWEGAVDVAGRFGSTSVSGVGYVEMTGYAAAFRAP